MANELKNLSDDELAGLCQDGVEEAFRELYDRYSARVINFAYRMLDDREDAADVLQETFQYFFGKLPEYSPEGKLGALLFRAARHLCINRLKKNRGINTVPLDEAMVTHCDYGEIISSIEKNELKEKVTEALKSIPPYYSEVIILKILDGLPYREIGEIVECPEGTVKSRLHNGLELLRKVVAGYEIE
ncbi:MAG: RNA polymerase sigma factor [Planctomycetota bacterium]